MRRALRVLFEPQLAAVDIPARHHAMMVAATATGDACLHVYAVPTDAVSLGRYLLPPPAGDVPFVPRYSGGRAMPLGPGFVGVALALPHRSALVGSEPLALSAEQVLNRCVRGIMAGSKAIGIELFYPGRDLLTVGSRACAMVSFTVESNGATLFEALLATERDFTALPLLLDRADPTGVVRIALWQPDQAVAIGAVLGRRLTFDELSDRIVAGYVSTFGMEPKLGASVGMTDALPPWCSSVPSGLDRRSSVTTMLGVLETHVGVSPAGRMTGLRITGDLIADPSGIARVEAGVVGCDPGSGEVGAAIALIYADPAHFLLGIGPTATLTDAIVRAATP